MIRLFLILSENADNVSRLTQLWVDGKSWFIGLGLGGVVILAVNVGLRFKQILSTTKIGKLIDPLLVKQEQANKQMVDLAKGTIDNGKELKKVVEVITKDIINNNIKNNKVINLLVEMLTMNIALSTSPTQLKTQALEIIKQLGLDLKSIGLLENVVNNLNDNDDIDKNNELHKIINGEL